MEETLSYSEENRQIRGKVAKPMLWLSMVSMFMIFAALTSAYVVRMKKGDWLQFQLPQMFYISTAVIILSSVTMNWALSSAKKNDYKKVKRASLITLILGLTFVILQFKAWGILVEQKIVFAGKFSNAAGSFLYALTGLHMVHLVGGIFALMVVWVRSLQQKYFVKKEVVEAFLGAKEHLKRLEKEAEQAKQCGNTAKALQMNNDSIPEAEYTLKILERKMAENILGLQLCAIFWHFLDALWIYLFLFLLFVR